MTAYVDGLSTRKVDKLVKAMGGARGVSKSEVSRICKRIDGHVKAFRERDLSAIDYPYLYLDATYVKSRGHHHVRSRAVVVAIAVTSEGRREVLGFAVGDGEDIPFWTDFLRSLVHRGLRGVKLAVSDAHAAIYAAVRTQLPDAAWQSCRIHFGRNIARRAGNYEHRRIAQAALATIYHQPDRDTAVCHYRRFAEVCERLSPRLGNYADDREVELTAYTDFPPTHWRKIWSTNPLERLMAEIKRRSRVVQLYPSDESVDRLVGAILAEQHDEWIVNERRYMSAESMRQIGHVKALSLDGQTQDLSITLEDLALQEAGETF